MFQKQGFEVLRVVTVRASHQLQNNKICFYQVQRRNFKNFGHKRDVMPKYTQRASFVILTALIASYVDWRW